MNLMADFMRIKLENRKGREKQLRTFIFFWMGIIGILLGVAYAITTHLN